MYDYWGSEVADETLAELKSAGVKMHIFRPWKYFGSLARAFSKMSRRNHRKSLIVDGARSASPAGSTSATTTPR